MLHTEWSDSLYSHAVIPDHASDLSHIIAERRPPGEPGGREAMLASPRAPLFSPQPLHVSPIGGDLPCGHRVLSLDYTRAQAWVSILNCEWAEVGEVLRRVSGRGK